MNISRISTWCLLFLTVLTFSGAAQTRPMSPQTAMATHGGTLFQFDFNTRGAWPQASYASVVEIGHKVDAAPHRFRRSRLSLEARKPGLERGQIRSLQPTPRS